MFEFSFTTQSVARGGIPQRVTRPTFEKMIGTIGRHRAADKASAGWFAAPFGGTGKRSADNALRWPIVRLDVDAMPPGAPVPDWFDRLSGISHETHSSTPEAPRLRGIFETNRPITRDESLLIGAALTADMLEEFGPAVVVDPSTFRPEQPCFLPPTWAEIRRHEGAPLDADL